MKTGVELLPLPQHRIERIHSPERSAEVSLLAETRALACRWTLGLVALICVLNFGLFNGAAGFSGAWPTGLQFDETAVRDGQLWRLLTGNLVHWNAMHFGLDAGVFLILGLLYERYFRRSYFWLVLFCGLAVGIACLLYLPEHTLYRGLSGVTAGQFVMGIWIEIGLALRDRRRWLWLAPATAVFLTWIVYTQMTGRSLFSTEALIGNIQPAGIAHLAGAGAALLFLVLAARFFRPADCG